MYTVSAFKDLFYRDFPYLPVFDLAKQYVINDIVFYNELFYIAIANTIGNLPTDTDFFEVNNDVKKFDYVLDEDIEKAFEEADITFNQALFSSDDNKKKGYLYLTAHYLVNDLRTASEGLNSAGYSGILSSRSVGSVSESYSVPSYLNDNEIRAFYYTTKYGVKYLNMILPRMKGNVMIVTGKTQS